MAPSWMEAFVWSLKNGDLDAVQQMVKQENININDPLEGRRPMHYAADYGQKEVLEYLIQRGADVNATDCHGISPLLAAIWEGHADCVRLMLKKGALASGKSPDGKSYIDCAEQDEIKDILLQQSSSSS